MIKATALQEMAQICAELVRQGIIFTCEKVGNGWNIHCTGY